MKIIRKFLGKVLKLSDNLFDLRDEWIAGKDIKYKYLCDNIYTSSEDGEILNEEDAQIEEEVAFEQISKILKIKKIKKATIDPNSLEGMKHILQHT